jgi:hypothetical protein
MRTVYKLYMQISVTLVNESYLLFEKLISFILIAVSQR